MKTFNLPEFEKIIYQKSKTFVVIGAFDGESHDNFFNNIKEKNNKSDNKIVFVEPIKKYYESLIDKVKSLIDINVFCENSAISNKKEIVKMVSVKPNLTSKYGWFIDGCACVIENEEPINIYMKNVDDSDMDIELIETMTFDDLIKKYDLINIDFLQIDTEGYDQRILESIDFSERSINFIKFEKHYLMPGFIESFVDLLDPLDYSYYWDNDNYYFIKNSIING